MKRESKATIERVEGRGEGWSRRESARQAGVRGGSRGKLPQKESCKVSEKEQDNLFPEKSIVHLRQLIC